MFNRLISNDAPRSRLLAALLIVILLGLALAPFLFPGVKALSVAAKVLIFVVLVAGLVEVGRWRVVVGGWWLVRVGVCV